MYYAFDYRSSYPPICIGGVEHARGTVLCFKDKKNRNQYLKRNKYIGMINKSYAELLKNNGIKFEQVEE
jgi:hypothetical protein